MKESDWKTFKKIKESALDQFCRGALAEFGEIISEEGTAHERYLHLYRRVENTDRRMFLLFDGLSRSKAALQLRAIRGEGLAKPELLSQLSEDFEKQTDPERL